MEWKVVPTPRYKELSNEFRAAAEMVVEQAKNKNSDGAALAYLDISMLCFKCHKPGHFASNCPTSKR